MSIIKAALGSVKSTLRDQYKEVVKLENNAMAPGVLVQRVYPTESNGQKSTKGVISHDSRIFVPAGCALAIVQKGAIVDFVADAGEYIYQDDETHTIFAESFGQGLKDIFAQTMNRTTYGGEAAQETRAYYINTKEITGIKYGTSTPMMYDDPIYMGIEISFYGSLTLRISNPLLLLNNVVGVNIEKFKVDDIAPQLKEEFLTTLQSKLAEFAYQNNIPARQLPRFQREMADFMNTAMNWDELRGLQIVSCAMTSVSIPDKYNDQIRRMDEIRFNAANKDGLMATAMADSMVNASKNEGMGGMGMTLGMGAAMGSNVGQMMNSMMGNMMNPQAQAEGPNSPRVVQPTQPIHPVPVAPVQEPVTEKPVDGWTCSCGAVNTGKFCMECGTPKPVPKPAAESWTCSCGTINTGKFCMECGAHKPETPKEKFCPNCGTKVSGKFCPECGTKVKE